MYHCLIQPYGCKISINDYCYYCYSLFGQVVENVSHCNGNVACDGSKVPVIGRETILVDEFRGTNDHAASNSVPLTTYWQSTDGPGPADKVVRIEEPPPLQHVDILIRLPQIDLQWLEEWSDLESASVFNLNTLTLT